MKKINMWLTEDEANIIDQIRKIQEDNISSKQLSLWDESMPVYQTYRQWATIGWRVRKGEKSHHRINGLPVFSRDQVVYRPTSYKSNK